MKRMIFGLVAAATLALTGVANATSVKDIAAATYKLYEDGHGICSMTHVKHEADSDIFITAAHCVTEDGDYTVRLPVTRINKDGTEEQLSDTAYNLKVVKTLADQDEALLQTKAGTNLPDETVDIATEEEAKTLGLGDKLMVLGFPFAEEKTITYGEFIAKVPSILDIKTPLYKTTTDVAPGNSGGALYAQFDDTWKLIGITSAMSNRNGTPMSYFTPVEVVHKTLAGFVGGTTSKAPQPVMPKSGRTDEQ